MYAFAGEGFAFRFVLLLSIVVRLAERYDTLCTQWDLMAVHVCTQQQQQI
jgi:hypothetical protein